MQGTLDPIDRDRMCSFGTPERFLEWYWELEDDGEFPRVSATTGAGPIARSFYSQAASVFEHLYSIGGSEMAGHLRNDVGRLITQSTTRTGSRPV